MSISSVSSKKITTTSSTNSKNSANSSSDTHGLLFAGRNDAGKAQNDVVYANLDSKAKEVIASTIGKEAYVNPLKIAKALKAAGITATVGSSKVDPKDNDPTTYLEITNSDGSKSRIWDVGSDGGIGTQDIDLNSQLSSLKADIKAAASNSTSAATASNTTANNTATVANTTAATDVTDTTTTLTDTEDSNTENTTSNSTTGINNTTLTKDEYYSKLDELIAELKQNSDYKNYSDSQLEDIANQQLVERYS